jgi:osmotically-inducible protein OsmY
MKTDAQLQQDVMAELNWESAVHATEVGVQVKDGVVTLSGEVCSYAEKWAAEHAAQRVAGVKALAVALQVKLPSLGRRSDSDIAHSVQNVLEWLGALPVDSVKAMVEGGWVTLTGSVEWQYQRHAAVDAVRPLLGVRGVTDQMALKPQASTTAVKADIEAALQRRALTDAQQVTVRVRGAEVTLGGTVHSWAERDLAKQAAWSAPGVHQVVDDMALMY